MAESRRSPDAQAGGPAYQAPALGHRRVLRSDWQPLLAAYYGEISLIDNEVGRVLAHLDARGLAGDTLVVWTTDHGDTIGAHGICNKDYTMYEEIYRVPLLVRWPGVVAPGSASDAYVHHFLDLFATFVEVAGGEPGTGCHGRSLLSLLSGDAASSALPREAYCEFHGSHMGLYSMRLLTTDEYAYVYHTNDIDELYDRRADPWQIHNLAVEPGEHARALDDLRRRMVHWMASTDDHLYNEWTVDWLTRDETLSRAAPGRRRASW